VTTTDAMPQSAAERDLATAGQLQRMLLPRSPYTWRNWTAAHHYEPAGAVSGDYLDLVPNGDRLYFMLGDVSGKGVVASLLMAQLHAMFRTLIPFQASLEDLMTRASALLCASSLPAQYATLVSGYAEPDGRIVIVNAGHPPPLLVTASERHEVQPTGYPIGIFCESQFSTTTLSLAPGDALLLFTDGLTEARNVDENEYGLRIETAASATAGLAAHEIVMHVVEHQRRFRGEAPNADDVSVMAIRRS